MTDDLYPDRDLPGADDRDEELAGRLAVPPLDELTRRRLVRDALDASGAPARARRRPPWWAAAAAVVVVAVAVTALALRGGSGSGDRPTAASAPTTAAGAAPGPGAATDSGNAEQSSPSASQVLPSAPQLLEGAGALGDLGEVAGRATLRRRVTASERSFSTRKTFGAPAAGTGQTPTTLPQAIPCAAAVAVARPELGPVLASGSATFHGAPATVVTARTRSGDLVAVVVVDAGCVVKTPVTIEP